MSDDTNDAGKRNAAHQPAESQRRAEQPPGDDDELISSARGMSPRPRTTTAGGVILDHPGIEEDRARDLLFRRFTSYGARIQIDLTLHEGNVLCRLDGFDPELRVGYRFISHSDADVVSDIDSDTELEMRELAHSGLCFVLLVHDTRVSSLEELVVEVESFLSSLPTAEELRARRS